MPQEGDDVVIPPGRQILLDVSPPALGSLTVEGTLVFDDRDLELSAQWIMVHGAFRVGHPQRPYTHQATITLTGDDPDEDVMGMGTRGILLMGGTIDLHGRPPARTWTKLARHLEAGETTAEVVDDVGWKAGDELVIAPTDYFRIGRTERVALGAARGRELTLSTPLERFRWGLLQYIDEDGVTLTPTTAVTEAVIDERAEVGNLTRNIVIQGPDDELWRDRGFGAHVMIMRESEGRFDGVEFRRAGQAGRLARYPVHWHLWSYAGSDADGIDAEDQYVKNSAVWASANRCVVIHGTNGVTVSNNICYDISGHAIFLEDAVERRNVIENNLVLHVHIPEQSRRLQRHDERAAGFWLTNPDNIVRGNVGADSEGMGFWLAYPQFPLGNSKGVPIQPSHLQFGEFSSNVAHSNRDMGIMFDDVPVNDEGDVYPRHYRPTDTETEEGRTSVPYVMSNVQLYKHEAQWQTSSVSYWNRTQGGEFFRFIMADFNGTAFSGASICTIREALVVGSSLNNENEPLLMESNSLTLPGAARLGAASYHSDCQIADNVFVNLPAIPGKPSGAFGTSDYYMTGVDKGLVNNPNNRMINAHPGFRSVSPNLLSSGEGRQNYALSGALWDPHGYWGPAGNYWVYDLPFLTDGTDCSEPLSPHGNDRSCVGPYFGVYQFLLEGEDPYDGPGRTRPLHVTREDNDAVWFVDDGDCTPMLGPMRHFSAVQNGTYRVSFPAGQVPGDATDGTPGDSLSCDQMSGATPASNYISFTVTNVLREEDSFVLAVPFVGNATPTVIVTSRNIDEVFRWDSYSAYQSGNEDWQSADNGQYWRPIEPAANLDAVRASNGNRYWHDTSNDLVWLKVARMGIEPVENPATELYLPLSYLLRAD